MVRIINIFLATLAAFIGCASTSSQSSWREGLLAAPAIARPAPGHPVDPTMAASFDSEYQMLSYSTDSLCMRISRNVPAEVAASLRFVLELYHTADDDSGQVSAVPSREVEVMDAAVGSVRATTGVEHDRLLDQQGNHIGDVERLVEEDVYLYQTALKVCFSWTDALATARFLVVRTDANGDRRAGHDTLAAWRVNEER